MRKLSLRTKYFYGTGQTAVGIKNAVLSTSLLFYYTQILGLSGSLAGLAIFISLCFDAVTDPITGSFSDNLRSPWGRRHTLMYLSAVPCAISFYLIFAPPSGLGQTGLFAWLLFFSIALRGAMTLFQIPYMALGAELTEDYVGRTVVIIYRSINGHLGAAGAALVAFLFFFTPTPEYPNGQMNPMAYPASARIGSIVILVSIWMASLGTRKELPYLPKAPKKVVRFSLMQVYREVGQALSNPTFRRLFIGSLFGVVVGGITVTLLFHVCTYFWELKANQLAYVLAAGAMGAVGGAPFTKYANRWFDKKPTLLLGLVMGTLFAITPTMLRLLDLFPGNDSPFMLPVFLFFKFLAGIFGVQAAITTGSMIADIVDENELGTGCRQEGIFFSAQSFLSKAFHGLGVTIAGIGLDMIHFPAKAEPGTVDPGIVRNLGLFFVLAPAIKCFIAFIIFSRIQANRTIHEDTIAQLKINRIQETA